jgi:rhodanese-related sulfurtransferase
MASSTPDNLGRAVLGAFAILGVAVTIGMGHSLLTPVTLRADFSDRPLADPPPTESGPGDAVADPSAGAPADGHFLDLEQAHEAFFAGEVFLDARPRHEYDAAHIEGAYPLSTEAISEGQAGDVLDELLALGYSQPMVIYCHGGDCDASENTAIRLQAMGFTNLRIMKAGFDEWRDAGYEVQSP